jgi:hypothetical protein
VALVDQVGRLNRASVEQSGIGAVTRVTQYGDGLVARVVQQ